MNTGTRTRAAGRLAAHLCDSVLPIAPYRQWTLSFPKWIRYRLLRDMTLLSRVLRLFIRTVFSWQKRRAKAAGHGAVLCGSVTLIQFFGSLLQATPHFHSWLPDGVFTQAEDGTLTFHRLPPPEDRDIARLCGRIRARVLAVLDPEAEDIPPDDEDIALAAAQAGAVDPPLGQLALIDVQEPAAASAQKP